MTTERKHRCGGMLQPREVQVRDDRGGMLLVFRVPGLVCNTCQEELIERETMLAFEKSQTPTIVWAAPPASSRLFGSELIFDGRVTDIMFAA